MSGSSDTRSYVFTGASPTPHQQDPEPFPAVIADSGAIEMPRMHRRASVATMQTAQRPPFVRSSSQKSFDSADSSHRKKLKRSTSQKSFDESEAKKTLRSTSAQAIVTTPALRARRTQQLQRSHEEYPRQLISEVFTKSVAPNPFRRATSAGPKASSSGGGDVHDKDRLGGEDGEQGRRSAGLPPRMPLSLSARHLEDDALGREDVQKSREWQSSAAAGSPRNRGEKIHPTDEAHAPTRRENMRVLSLVVEASDEDRFFLEQKTAPTNHKTPSALNTPPHTVGAGRRWEVLHPRRRGSVAHVGMRPEAGGSRASEDREGQRKRRHRRGSLAPSWKPHEESVHENPALRAKSGMNILRIKEQLKESEASTHRRPGHHHHVARAQAKLDAVHAFKTPRHHHHHRNTPRPPGPRPPGEPPPPDEDEWNKYDEEDDYSDDSGLYSIYSTGSSQGASGSSSMVSASASLESSSGNSGGSMPATRSIARISHSVEPKKKLSLKGSSSAVVAAIRMGRSTEAAILAASASAKSVEKRSNTPTIPGLYVARGNYPGIAGDERVAVFSRGDAITVLRRVDASWVDVMCNGKPFLAPLAFLAFVGPLPNTTSSVTAKRDELERVRKEIAQRREAAAERAAKAREARKNKEATVETPKRSRDRALVSLYSQRLMHQLMYGCGGQNCASLLCASNPKVGPRTETGARPLVVETVSEAGSTKQLPPLCVLHGTDWEPPPALCEACEGPTAVATQYCEDCGKALCVACCDSVHSEKGPRRDHHVVSYSAKGQAKREDRSPKRADWTPSRIAGSDVGQGSADEQVIGSPSPSTLGDCMQRVWRYSKDNGVTDERYLALLAHAVGANKNDVPLARSAWTAGLKPLPSAARNQAATMSPFGHGRSSSF